jgi:hypothetical protein
MQRQLVGAFEGQAWSWRRTPRAKAQHERGAVGLLRLEWTGPDCGPLLRAGTSRLVIGRYSRASLRDGALIVPGIAIKLFRTLAPAVDLLFLPRKISAGPLPQAWAAPFSTSTEDPTTDPGLPTAARDAARLVAAGLTRVAEAAGADRDRVRPHLLPLPAGMPAGRFTVAHTPRASNLLARCGEAPFDAAHHRMGGEVSLVAAMAGKPWAELRVDDEPDPRARLVLVSDLHLGPVGDRWLHFTHPRG